MGRRFYDGRFYGLVRIRNRGLAYNLVRVVALLALFCGVAGGHSLSQAQSVPSSTGPMDGNLFKNHVSVFGLGGAPTPASVISGPLVQRAGIGGYYRPYAYYYPYTTYYPLLYPYGYYPYVTNYGWGIPYYRNIYRGYVTNSGYGYSRINASPIQFGQFSRNRVAQNSVRNQRQRRTARGRVDEERALFEAQLAAAAESSAGRGTASIAAILHQKGRDYDSKKSESSRLVEKAQRAITQGKVGLAKMYFRMALNDLQGPAREQVQARLDALTTKTASSDSDSDSDSNR